MPIEITLVIFSILILIQIVIGVILVKKLNDSRKITDSLKPISTNDTADIANKNSLDLKDEQIKQDLDWQQKWQEEEKATRQRILDLQENIDRKETQLNLKLEKLENDKEKIEETKNTLRDIKSNLLQKTDEI